jgi:hypothetical protein
MNDRNDRQPNAGHPTGRLAAKFLGYELGYAQTGTKQIGVLFEFEDESFRGRRITWYGTFTPESFHITVRALKALGWQGKRLETLKGDLRMGTVVDLVCEVESYQGKERSRVLFVNSRGIRMHRPMVGDDQRAFADEVNDMLARGLGDRPAGGGGGADDGYDQGTGGEDDIPF